MRTEGDEAGAGPSRMNAPEWLKRQGEIALGLTAAGTVFGFAISIFGGVWPPWIEAQKYQAIDGRIKGLTQRMDRRDAEDDRKRCDSDVESLQRARAAYARDARNISAMELILAKEYAISQDPGCVLPPP